MAITLYLIGFAGTGKYTIATEIGHFGYKIVDNHLINNPVFSLLNLDGKTPIADEAWETIQEIRHALLKFISLDPRSNYVFTNELLNHPYDYTLYDQVKLTAECRDSTFIPILLTIGRGEHQRRIASPGRKEKFKQTTLALEHLEHGLIVVQHPNLHTMDVTSFSPQEAAQKIMGLVDQTLTMNQIFGRDEQNVLSIKRLNETHSLELQDFLDKFEDFFMLCEGEKGVSSALLQACPSSKDRTLDKFVLGFYEEGNMIALMDLIRNYPQDKSWTIGYFLLHPALQGTGKGSALLQRILPFIQEFQGQKLRCAVQEQNPRALHFWQKVGFVITDKVEEKLGQSVNQTYILEKHL
jgi:ribosomal protein S18 acetylase RimI-like enzyme